MKHDQNICVVLTFETEQQKVFFSSKNNFFMKNKLRIAKLLTFLNSLKIQKSTMAWRSKGKDNQELINQLERMLRYAYLLHYTNIYLYLRTNFV